MYMMIADKLTRHGCINSRIFEQNS